MSTTTPSTRLGMAVTRMPDDREAWDEHLGMIERRLRRVRASGGYKLDAVEGTELDEAIGALYAMRLGLRVERVPCS